ncbi:MAG: hypothetical protein QME81_10285 [bacterium]|nr:hypothetical protein [bacterium]
MAETIIKAMKAKVIMRQGKSSFKAVGYLCLLSLFIVCLESVHHTCGEHYSHLCYSDSSDNEGEPEHSCPGCWWGQNGQAIAALILDSTPTFFPSLAFSLPCRFFPSQPIKLPSARGPPPQDQSTQA